MRKLIFIPLCLATIICGCKSKNHQDRVESNDDFVLDENMTASNIEEKDYRAVPSYIVRRLSMYETYKSVTHGETDIKAGLIKATQVIDTTVIKSEYIYSHTESNSKLASTYHEAYFHNDAVLYKNKAKHDYTKTNLNDYLSDYGTYPLDKAIEGFLVGESAIKSASRLAYEDDNHLFHVVFDTNKATNNVKIQMRTQGDLDDYPTFSAVSMDLRVKNDFTLKSINFHAEYTAKKGFKCEMNQNYTVTFSSFNESVEVPNLNYIKTLFN